MGSGCSLSTAHGATGPQGAGLEGYPSAHCLVMMLQWLILSRSIMHSRHDTRDGTLACQPLGAPR